MSADSGAIRAATADLRSILGNDDLVDLAECVEEVRRRLGPAVWLPMEEVEFGGEVLALRSQLDEAERLLDLLTEHWPGQVTGYCLGCDDVRWPCDVAYEAMLPRLEARTRAAHKEGDKP